MKLRLLTCSLLLAATAWMDAPANARQTRPVSPAYSSQGTQAATSRTVSGTVHDSTGGAVSGALVIVRAASRADQQTVTGTDGTFTLAIDDGADLLIVRAGGFAEIQQRLEGTSTPLAIVLQPATLLETVVVTSTRSEERLGNLPASINIVTREEIRSSP